MTRQVLLPREARADDRQAHDHGNHDLAPDLAYNPPSIVNVVYLGIPFTPNWLLVDAGIPGSGPAILKAAQERFGDFPPRAILLTHGHLDHCGALQALLKTWDVPVYAHRLEHPYLSGKSSYPEADPSVGGGCFSLLSPLVSTGPFDFSRHLQVLPEDGSVPSRPDFRWIHTPGHTAGHVSFWRERDRTLIAGDAFLTTNQESLYSIFLQAPEMHGPPQPFTPDWAGAADSVRRLRELRPELAVCGHGRAMRGPEMRKALDKLADEFEFIAMPQRGRYLHDPATAANGKAYLPRRLNRPGE